MRLDIRQVQAPWLLALFADEVDGAVGGVDRFRVLFRYSRRQMGVAHLPAAEDLAVFAFGGVGPVMPGVCAVIAKVAQVMGVGRRLAFIGEQRVIGVDAVMA